MHAVISQDWGKETWGMQSAECSMQPVMLMHRGTCCSLWLWFACSPRLVLHIPWFDLAASSLLVLVWPGVKLTKAAVVRVEKTVCMSILVSRCGCCIIVLSRSISKPWHQLDWPWVFKAILRPTNAIIQAPKPLVR
jgi:hypothetical protein